MSLVLDYRSARAAEEVARLKRVLVLRAMLATGSTQRQIAEAVGVSQPAISQQLKAFSPAEVDAATLVDAGGAILRRVAENRGFADLAVFGSVALGQAGPDSDIDLIVKPPPGTTIRGLVDMKQVFEAILGRAVDLVTYGGLQPGIDDDILREAVLL